MSLPEKFVTDGLELAKGATLFGVPFDQMSRDELIAAAAQGWNQERKQREAYAGTAKARAHYFVAEAMGKV